MTIDLSLVRTEYAGKVVVDDFVGDSYQVGGLAIIGQDAGITTSSTVSKALMLNEQESTLYEYVTKHIVEPLGLALDRVVAFNLVQDVLKTSTKQIAKEKNYNFYNLVHAIAEDTYPAFSNKNLKYKPSCVVTLGNPVFEFIKNKNVTTNLMPLAIRSDFARCYSITLACWQTRWIPCVHIRTYKTSSHVYKYQDQRLALLAQEHQVFGGVEGG